MFTSIRLAFICSLLVVFGLLPAQVSAQTSADLADGVPGIPSYSQAQQFAQDYFLSASDYSILPDPDGGYGIFFNLTNYDPIAVLSAMTAYFQQAQVVTVDLQGEVSPIDNPLIVNAQYSMELEYYPIQNAAEAREALAGSVVPALIEWDFGRDGFDGTTQDFSTLTMIAVDSTGLGSSNVSGLTFPVTGDWRYRMTIDPNGLYEPLSGGNRANNTSGWENYTVVSNPNGDPSTDPDSSSWKIVGDFDSWGPGYADRSTGGETCTRFRGWACDTRAGSDLVRIDMIVDGTVYDTFYPHLLRAGTVNPWWGNLSQYSYTPGCPARPEGAMYGFDYPTPASFKDNVERDVQLQATRSDGHSEFIVNAGWTPVYKNFPVQCAPETNIVDLAANIGLMTTQMQDNPFTVPDLVVRNHGDITTGESFTVVLQFDYGSDGFSPANTADFEISRNVSALGAGQQMIPNFGAITHSVAGDWRVRMIVDQAELVEPAASGHRANNRTPWRSYTVTSNEVIGSAVPKCQLLASESEITAGGSVTLTWNMSDANPQATLTDVGTVSESDGQAGTTVSPVTDTNYTMTVQNSVGDTNVCSAPVTVLPAPALDMTVVVNDVDTYTAPTVFSISSPEDKLEIEWSAQRVDSCAKNFTLGNSIAGTFVLDPSLIEPGQTSSYTVSCQNSIGDDVQKTVSVQLAPFTVNLYSSSALIRQGQVVDFTYDVIFPVGTSYDVNCELSGVVNDSFTTNVSVTDSVSSGPIQSTSIASMTCTEPLTGYTFTSAEARVEVLPNYQET